MFKRKKRASASRTRNIITKMRKTSPIPEQFRTIRTNIQFSSVDQEMRTVLVTSPGGEAGKSVTSINLAIAYALQGMRTLLIDADLRRPTVHFTFQLNNLKGLSNVLAGHEYIEQVVLKTDIQNLDFLTCGPIPPNPSELLASERMRNLLGEVKKVYDFIVIDTPPALAVADTTVLANIIDGSLVVLRSGKTETAEAKKTIKLMKAARSRMLGVVLNDCPKKTSSYQYYSQS